MGKFHNETNEFTKRKGLELFASFIRNHDGELRDRDDNTFNILRGFIKCDEIARIFEETFSKQELMLIRDRRGTVDFDSFKELVLDLGCGKVLERAWLALPRDTVRGILLRLVENALACCATKSGGKDFLQGRLGELQATLGLSDTERDILLVLYLIKVKILAMPGEGDGYRDSRTRGEDRIISTAKCLDCSVSEVRKLVSASGKLRRFGCIDKDIDFEDSLLGFLDGLEDAPLDERFFQKCTGETLPWNFFGKLASEHGPVLKNIIAARKPGHGVHILLYGEPGTGKTSFARSLAREMSLDCYCVAQADNEKHDFGAISKDRRFAALQICDMRVDHARSLLIVDEADCMLRDSQAGFFMASFGGREATSDGKALLNGLLDTIKTPTVWITNLPARALDESTRRRFDYSIHFDKLTAPQRLAIWKNSVQQHKLDALFDDAALEEFSRRYETSAGGVALALRNIANLAPCKEDAPALVAKLMEPHCELLNIKPDDNLLPAKDYSLAGLNIKSATSLERIVEAVRRFQTESTTAARAGASPDRPRMNLLLSGPPGTGKTEFVKFLGKTLDTKILVKMGSDLISKWVGETEQNIAKAFREAKSEKAILFLDEIDGLMQSREGAQRSWEVTQVNELLQQMENFAGVLIAATNFPDGLDAASLRRFTFKLEFAHLDDAGKKHFFERMFGVTLMREDALRLEKIPDLSPGDFRTVRQSLYYLGADTTNADRLAALEQESHAKKHTRYSSQRRIGF